MKFDGVCVGVVAKPVGIKGQVKIHPYTTSPDSFLQYMDFFLFDGTPLVFQNPRINEKNDIITFIEDCKDRTTAEAFHLKNIYIKRDSLQELASDEYYLEDLSGLETFNQNNEKIGILNAALDYGAGTFLDIKLSETGRVATLPFNKESVICVDLNEGSIKVDDSFILR